MRQQVLDFGEIEIQGTIDLDMVPRVAQIPETAARDEKAEYPERLVPPGLLPSRRYDLAVVHVRYLCK